VQIAQQLVMLIKKDFGLFGLGTWRVKLSEVIGACAALLTILPKFVESVLSVPKGRLYQEARPKRIVTYHLVWDQRKHGILFSFTFRLQNS